MRAGMKKLLKVTGWVLGALVSVVVVLYLVLVVVNWNDRPPSQAALRFAALYRDRPTVADSDNAYVFAQGFGVAPGEDPQAAGLRRIEWMNRGEYDLREPGHGDPVKTYDLQAARAAPIAALADTCGVATSACIAALADSDAVVAEWLSSEQWLFDRYRMLLARSAWVETARLDARMILPDYSGISAGQKLLLLRAWTLAGQKDAAAVRELLSEDLRFWRQMSASAGFIVTRIFGTSAVTRHFSFGNEVLRRLPAELVASAMPKEWSVGVTDAERSMLGVFVGEWVFWESLVSQVRKCSSQPCLGMEEDHFSRLTSRLHAPMFQPQDFSNRVAERYERVVAALDSPLAEYPAALLRTKEIAAEVGPIPTRLYNIRRRPACRSSGRN